MKKKSITLTLAGDLYDELETVAEATGIPMPIWLDDAIEDIVDKFRGYDGKINIRKAMQATDKGEVYVLVLGKREIFGHPYYRIWDPESESTLSIPAEKIRFIEE